jgi:hypothetical protein
MGVLLSSSNLLRTFGKDANVSQQFATDKALRRKASAADVADVANEVTGDVTSLQDAVTELQGQVVTGVACIDGNVDVPHTLGRIPAGAIVILFDGGTGGETHCSEVTIDKVVIASSWVGTATVWIV